MGMDGWRDRELVEPPMQGRDPCAVQAWHEAINAYRCGYWG